MLTKEEKKKIRNKYKVPLCTYSNIAISSVETILNFEREHDKTDPITIFLEKANTPTFDKLKYWKIAKENFYFVNYLYEKTDYFIDDDFDTNIEAIELNFKLFVNLLSVLRAIRNFYSHYRHKVPEFNNQVAELILDLYHYACVDKDIPEIFKAKRALFRYDENEDSEDYINVLDDNEESKRVYVNFRNQFDTTGYVFFISLFLKKHETNKFLENLELSSLEFNERKERQIFKEQNPDKELPEELRVKAKLFLYARDVYTKLSIRGHRDNIVDDKEALNKEKAFSILEYLKQCPKERLSTKFSDKYQETSLDYVEHEEREEKNDFFPIEINGKFYKRREKNKFFDYVVKYLEEELDEIGFSNHPRYKIEFARRQDAIELNKIKTELQKESSLNRVCRYHKMIWETPLDRNFTENGYEFGYPYYYEYDSNEVAKELFIRFTVKESPEQYYITKFSINSLMEVVESYLKKFPVWEEKPDTVKQKFFTTFSDLVIKQVKYKIDKPKNSTSKNVTKEQISRRIAELDSNLELDRTNHEKVDFIIKSWNKILSYGEENNFAHAKDSQDIIGGKRAYQELVKTLTKLSNADVLNKDDRLIELFCCLKSLKGRKGKSYFDKINSELFRLKVVKNSGSPKPLTKSKSFGDFYLQAIEYRKKQLNEYKHKLENEFNLNDWRPRFEMRWLAMKDIRTKTEASNYPQKEHKSKNTQVVNVDAHSYSAVGIGNIANNKQGYSKLRNELHYYEPNTPLVAEPYGNKLNIDEFYQFENWMKLKSTVRHHISSIKRQDVVLSHIAYYYMLKSEPEQTGRQLNELDYQKSKIKIPFDIGDEKLYVNIYYRHLKQNRNRLPKRLVCSLLKFLKLEKIVESEIDFNDLKLVSKNEELSCSEKESLTGLKLKNVGISILDKSAEGKKEEIKSETFFVRTKKQQTLSNYIESYQLCRKGFIDNILRLERLAYNNYGYKYTNGSGFSEIANFMEEKGKISPEERKCLIDLRNCALHIDFPKRNLIPENIYSYSDEGEKYIDYFGMGMQIIRKLRSEKTKNNSRK